MNKLCIYCLAPFETPPKAGKQIFCSVSCRQKKWAKENRAYFLKKQKAFRLKNPNYLGPKRQKAVDAINSIKEKTPCKDCGNCFPSCCIEFDHIGPNKHAEIGKMVSRGRPWDEVLNEMSKCEIVCSNCHRIRTKNRGSQHWKKTLDKDELPKSKH